MRPNSAARGEVLFNTIGCVACHGVDKQASGRREPADDGASAGSRRPLASLAGLGSKTTAEKLAEYLQNPTATDPSGRMPHMLLQQGEAMDLARFLCQTEDPTIKADLPEAPAEEKLLAAFKRMDPKAEDLAAFEKLPAAGRIDDLGKRVVIAKGCVNCHTIAPGGKPLAPAATLTALEDLAKAAMSPAASRPNRKSTSGRRRSPSPTPTAKRCEPSSAKASKGRERRPRPTPPAKR